MAKRRKAVRRAPRRRSHRGLKLLALTVALAIGFSLGRWPHQYASAAVRVVEVVKRHAQVPPAPAIVAPPDSGVGKVANDSAAIVGQIDEDSLSTSLKVIQQAPESSTVQLYISSPGGDGFAMMAWIDAVEIAKARSHVKVVCHTGSLVASAASIIFESSCDVRIANPRTIWLFHGVSAMAAGKAGDIEDRLKLLRALEHATAVLVAPHLRMTTAQYEAWIDRHDRFLTTDELMAMGGADSVFQ